MEVHTLIHEIVDQIEKKNRIHAAKLRENLKFTPPAYTKHAKDFFESYLHLLKGLKKNLTDVVDDYLHMIDDITHETMNFFRTGKYSSSSFEEVNQRVYGNPEIMEYYMHGLLLSQFLWKQHYEMLLFFLSSLPKHQKSTSRYLEVGAGHGFFLKQAISHMDPSTYFEVVDISPKSIELSKNWVQNDRISYKLCDIFGHSTEQPFDFITMGEVLEHVEDPLALLKKLKSLLSEKGTIFFTTPTNSPAIDHISLFKNTDEIRKLIELAGLTPVEEKEICSEGMPMETAHLKKITVMYGAFAQHKK